MNDFKKFTDFESNLNEANDSSEDIAILKQALKITINHKAKEDIKSLIYRIKNETKKGFKVKDSIMNSYKEMIRLA